MLQALCHVLGSVSHLCASKTSSPSALCAEASCQSLVKSVGLPSTTGGLWTWVWERKEANCYQPLWLCQDLPCIRKDFPVLGIKATHKKNSPALEIFVVACIGHWLDLVTSRDKSIEHFCIFCQQPLELELGDNSSFCSFWQKRKEDRKPGDQCVRAQFHCIHCMSMLGSPEIYPWDFQSGWFPSFSPIPHACSVWWKLWEPREIPLLLSWDKLEHFQALSHQCCYLFITRNCKVLLCCWEWGKSVLVLCGFWVLPVTPISCFAL